MNKRLVIIGSGVGMLIILVVLLSAYHSKGPGSSTHPNPGNPVVNTPRFAGEDAFINIGVTSDQTSNLEQALEQYLRSTGLKPSAVSFNSVQKIGMNKNAATPIWTVAFVVQLDNKDAYQAKMDYFNLTGVRLYLSSLDGSRLLYDSQNVGGSPDSL